MSIWFSKPPMDDHRFLAPFLPVIVIGRSKNLWSPDYPMGRPILFIGPTRHRHSTCCAPIGTHTGVALHGPKTTRVESWGPSIETHQNLGGRTTRTASQWAWLPSNHRIRADERALGLASVARATYIFMIQKEPKFVLRAAALAHARRAHAARAVVG